MGLLTLEVDGMNCEGCERTVTEAVTDVEGVSDATADRETGDVRVEFDPAKTTEGRITAAIREAGYSVKA